MQGIPLVCSYVPALMMTTTNVFPSYIINNDIEGNKYGVAILNNNKIGVNRNQAMHTNCAGKHCNFQRPHEIMNQKSGIWGTSVIVITNLDILHTVVVDYSTSRFMMRTFLTNRFNLDFPGYMFSKKRSSNSIRA